MASHDVKDDASQLLRGVQSRLVVEASIGHADAR